MPQVNKKLYAYQVGNLQYPDYTSPYKLVIDCNYDPSSGWSFQWKEKTPVGEEDRYASSKFTDLSAAVNEALVSKKFPPFSEYGNGWQISDNPDMPSSQEWKENRDAQLFSKKMEEKKFESAAKSIQNRNLYVGVGVAAIVLYLIMRRR